MLSKDVQFKDLGLLIIDEEQRFGVTHKEKIKQMKQNIDVLTLTATPIPRTLHMSLIGIRDMSVLEEAPQDRTPIQTYAAFLFLLLLSYEFLLFLSFKIPPIARSTTLRHATINKSGT